MERRDGSGSIGGWGFNGSYLTATSTFYKNEKTAAKYGIYSSDWSGGSWDRDYTSNCFSGNADVSGHLSPDAAKLQTYPTCTTNPVSPNLNVSFLNEVLCDSQVKVTGFGCQPGDHYPRRTRVVMHPLPGNLKGMPNPCAGVPANPWCRARRPVASGRA